MRVYFSQVWQKILHSHPINNFFFLHLFDKKPSGVRKVKNISYQSIIFALRPNWHQRNILLMVLAAAREISRPARSAGKRSNCCCISGGSCHTFIRFSQPKQHLSWKKPWFSKAIVSGLSGLMRNSHIGLGSQSEKAHKEIEGPRPGSHILGLRQKK